MTTPITSKAICRQDVLAIVACEKPLTAVVNCIDLTEQEEVVAQGWIKVYDVTPQNEPPHEVIDKVYQDTAETILQSAESSEYTINVLVRSSFPLVEVNGTAGQLTEVADMGHYEGTIPITLDDSAPSNIYEVEAQAITPDDFDGPIDTVLITVTKPPEILTMSFTGGYPGTQTELKAGDTFQITGTLDRAADAIEIQDLEACSYSLEAIAVGVTFTITGTIADRGTTVQALAAHCRARDAISGAFGGIRSTNELTGGVDGTDLVNLNNLYPTLTFGAITYPGAQQALKNSESAIIAVTSSDFDTLSYSSPNVELNIDSGTPTQVDVTRIGGTYNVTVDNLRGTATRDANDATTITNEVVFIAHTAANIEIVLPATRLRSGGNDGTVAQDHTITLNTTQLVVGTPTTEADSGGARGAFTDAWTSVAAQSWERTLQVIDSDEKGVFSWESASITNLAGLVTSIVATGPTYELGGFVARTLTFPAFSQSQTFSVPVSDYTKLQAGIFTATGGPAVLHAVQGDLTQATDEFTVLSPIGVSPQTLFWNDAIAASTNSSGTAQITDLEEVV